MAEKSASTVLLNSEILVQEAEDTHKTDLSKTKLTICMVGDSKIGKSSLIKTFKEGEFPSDELP